MADSSAEVDYKYHPVAKIFPMMEGEEFQGFVDDIKLHGLKEKIVLYADPDKGNEKFIVDGRNRYRACKKANIQPLFRELKLGKAESLVKHIVSLNLIRRHLTASQKAASAAEMLPLLQKEAKERQRHHAATTPGKPSANGPAASSGAGEKGRTARGEAATATGASPRAVQDAKFIKEKSPELFAKVMAGEVTTNEAKSQLLRMEKSKNIAAAAATAPEAGDAFELVVGDCREVLPEIEKGSVSLIVADPPYNQGIDYGKGKKADSLTTEEYLSFSRSWLEGCKHVLSPTGSLFVIIPDDWAAHIRLLCESLGFFPRAWIKWYETFGVNCTGNFNRTSRHILYFTVAPKKFTFNASAVNQESERQKIGDKRAAPGGKIWDDVWQVPRLVDNAKERIPGFPTQMPMGIIRPIVECASMPGDLVIDPFSGSGTTIEACVLAPSGARRAMGIEISKKYAELSDQRVCAAIATATKKAS